MVSTNRCAGCFSNNRRNYPCPYCGYAGPTDEATLYLPPDSVLVEKYQIGRVLGQGGFGITYLGWDLNLDMKLAIKEFFPQGLVSRLPGQSRVITLAGTESHQFAFWQERFLQEAKTLARFEQHPNIISVRDYFKANNTAYMIMSYVEGQTLEAYLKQAGGKLTYSKAIEIMMPVMDALREVHEVGIMHRDISPDNIFIDNRGRVVLLDFGAARQELRDISKSISVILKAGYAPEEQYRSRGKQGPWTDVYAVAATIYHLITGKVPPESIDRMAEEVLIAPSELGVDITPGQEKRFLKALAVKAQDRYRGMEEFQAELLDSRIITLVTTDADKNNCPYCGETVEVRARKCRHCQSMIEPQLPKDNIKLCRYCLKSIPSKAVKCMYCRNLTIDERYKHCHFCGERILLKAIICKHCRSHLFDLKKCPFCRRDIPVKAQICRHCMMKISDNIR